jgi:hypothetical protein
MNSGFENYPKTTNALRERPMHKRSELYPRTLATEKREGRIRSQDLLIRRANLAVGPALLDIIKLLKGGGSE